MRGGSRQGASWRGRRRRRPLRCRCADRDVERQLGQAAGCRDCCRGWTSGRPDVVCLQETKLADDKLAELLGAELEQRGYAIAAHGEAAWNGVAILSRVGLDDVVAGTAGRPGLPASGGARGGCDVRRRPGGLGLRPERAHTRLGPLSLQARLAGVAARRACGRAGGDRRLRRREHRADRRGRLRSRRLRRPDACHAARARGAGGASRTLGFHDVVRDRWPHERVFTYWDYRAGMFHQDCGMRIDLVLASARGRRPRAGPPGWTARPARARGRAITRR